MNKTDLLKLLNTIPDDAEIDISVNVSNPQDKSTDSDRAFVIHVHSVLHSYGKRYTILATGCKNF